MINGIMTIENARKKARNYANCLNETMVIVVYNDNNKEGIRGHHLVNWGGMADFHKKYDYLDFVEKIEPNSESYEVSTIGENGKSNISMVESNFQEA